MYIKFLSRFLLFSCCLQDNYCLVCLVITLIITHVGTKDWLVWTDTTVECFLIRKHWREGRNIIMHSDFRWNVVQRIYHGEIDHPWHIIIHHYTSVCTVQYWNNIQNTNDEIMKVMHTNTWANMAQNWICRMSLSLSFVLPSSC